MAVAAGPQDASVAAGAVLGCEVFWDLGANVGFFTLLAAPFVGCLSLCENRRAALASRRGQVAPA
jgi:hypothetical protein